jgi:hypothetical protein
MLLQWGTISRINRAVCGYFAGGPEPNTHGRQPVDNFGVGCPPNATRREIPQFFFSTSFSTFFPISIRRRREGRKRQGNGKGEQAHDVLTSASDHSMGPLRRRRRVFRSSYVS